MVREVLGVRLPVVSVSPSWLHLAARARAPGLRPDQLLRLEEDKIVDIAETCVTFGWQPFPLAQRIEQAVGEVDRSR
jgi:hypothetical protein